MAARSPQRLQGIQHFLIIGEHDIRFIQRAERFAVYQRAIGAGQQIAKAGKPPQDLALGVPLAQMILDHQDVMPDAARPESKAATTIPTTVNCVRFIDSPIHRSRELQAGRPLKHVLAVSAAVGRLAVAAVAVATARVRSRCLVPGETASGTLADLGPFAAIAAARKLDLARLETTPRSLPDGNGSAHGGPGNVRARVSPVIL